MNEHRGRTCVLMVEDDPNIVDLVRSNLQVRGFDTVVSTDGRRAMQLLETEQPDIVLLDLMLPEADGMQLCRTMRERSGIGIIVVSARGGEHDKVTALNMGADDYLTKPFGVEELMARITATLRRTRPPTDVPEPESVLTLGDVRVDLAAQQVFRTGEPVHLTPTEFDLLVCLAGKAPAVLTREHLLAEVWDWPDAAGTRTVDSHVKSLRGKLGPDLVRTVHGVGYALEVER